MLEFATQREFVLERLCLQPDSLARALHDRAVRHSTASHKEGDTHNTIVTCQTHFGAGAVFHGVEQRDDGSSREVHIVQLACELVDNCTERKRDLLKLW